MANDKGHRLTPEDLELALEMLREGQRQQTIAKYFGVSSVAFVNRRNDNPEYGLRWSRADAEGEMNTRRLLGEAAAKGLPTTSYQWILEHRYGWSAPLVKAKIEELRARTAANKPAPAADVKIWAEMVSLIPGRRPVVIQQPAEPVPEQPDGDQ